MLKILLRVIRQSSSKQFRQNLSRIALFPVAQYPTIAAVKVRTSFRLFSFGFIIHIYYLYNSAKYHSLASTKRQNHSKKRRNQFCLNLHQVQRIMFRPIRKLIILFNYNSLMQVCHGAVFLYQGDTGYLYAVIVMGIVLGVYMLFRMCKLCFSAFSYSNFHIHETYKFYAIAIIALAFTIMFHKTQLEYINVIQDDSITAIDNVTQEGYKILIEIFGIISIFFSRVLYTLNGFIWLLITLGCDYTPESELTMSRLAFSLHESKIKQNIRKRIQVFKVITVYFAYPLFILLSLIGTLEQEETWCSISKAALIITSVSTVAILAIGSGLFLYRRKND